jgi:hypothetical protein
VLFGEDIPMEREVQADFVVVPFFSLPRILELIVN